MRKTDSRTSAAPRRRQDFQNLLTGPTFTAVGVYDAISARAAESAEFSSLLVTGYGVAATYGYPDIGLLSQREVFDATERIVSSTSLPVIADADTGYGGVLNVMRTVEVFEQMGAAAIQIEDQTFPKRCGSMSGKSIIDVDEMRQKVNAAVTARTDASMPIIVRTDALLVSGLEDAIARAVAYEQEGADVILLHGTRSFDEIAECAGHISVPLAVISSESKKSIMARRSEYERAGARLVEFPLSLLFAQATMQQHYAKRLVEETTNRAVADDVMPFDTFTDFMAMNQWRDLEAKWVSATE
ncbi:isocitrate lyase/PEP mutase family protein [Saccharopolyspora spinosa]|uniref:Methylisocitrate lyase n=1 Tax=Saccharopolyspora spinosa TaxID=60894 RepID=A0A2N3Y6U6_SACSN|nr:isocitrate lyase/PEP mutase family protein [Saccharopolyspora spinosa]PKW18588.1 methylisocitrate lyase [Saccharopolyspora spinosa]